MTNRDLDVAHRFDRLRHVVSHLVATRSDRRTNPGLDGLSLQVDELAERAFRSGKYATLNATPTGVDGRHSVAGGDEHGYAVGDKHGGRDANALDDEDISAPPGARLLRSYGEGTVLLTKPRRSNGRRDADRPAQDLERHVRREPLCPGDNAHEGRPHRAPAMNRQGLERPVCRHGRPGTLL